MDQRLFNAAVVIHRGRVLGVVPTSHLPNYREYYEKRQFCAARDAVREALRLFGSDVRFGPGVIFEATEVPDFAVAVGICDDLWAPIAPSTTRRWPGPPCWPTCRPATSRSAKPNRMQLRASQSARAIVAYLYAAAGVGESTTDVAWDGHALVYEDGDLLAEGDRYGRETR